MHEYCSQLCRAALSLSLGACIVLSSNVWARDIVIDPYDEYRDEVSRGEFQYDETLDVPWIENETEVLAPPKEEDLVVVDAEQIPAGLTLLVDKRRITVGDEDRIIRLWLVARDRSGTENGSFEGYRCETREYKVYAYANPNSKPQVRKANRPRWMSIAHRVTGNYRGELLEDYFCGIRGTRTAHEIREAMTGEFQREYFFSN